MVITVLAFSVMVNILLLINLRDIYHVLSALRGSYIRSGFKTEEAVERPKTFKEKQDEAFSRMMNFDISDVYGVRKEMNGGDEQEDG